MSRYIRLQFLARPCYYQLRSLQLSKNFSSNTQKMGGSAFNSPKHGSLQTPRIPNHIYQRLVSHFKSILSGFYSRVESSPEAPEKSEHGDIDILVEGPLKTCSSSKVLQSALGAATCIDVSPTAYFAIWDDQLAAYVQLDVHICRQGGIEWECFHRSYGDLWNILGVMGKPFGISVNDTGVRISAESIEKRNRKASMLFLTDSPQEAIELFGCSWEQYQKGFRTVEEFFAFCAQCRFINYEKISWKLIGRRDEGRLKEKRPLCRRWVTEYLPSIAPNGVQNETAATSRPGITREAVLEEALTRFNKWHEYRCLTAGWNKDNFDKEMWDRIAGLLPVEKRNLGHVLRPLKKRLQKEDETTREKGFGALEAEWRNSRESKWADIALGEWKTLLEIRLAEAEARKRGGIQKSKEAKQGGGNISCEF